jgi:U3 small nucleolar ribonucleoprotein component
MRLFLSLLALCSTFWLGSALGQQATEADVNKRTTATQTEESPPNPVSDQDKIEALRLQVQANQQLAALRTAERDIVAARERGQQAQAQLQAFNRQLDALESKIREQCGTTDREEWILTPEITWKRNKPKPVPRAP